MKPLVVFPDSVREVMGGMMTSHFESNCCLDWVLAILDEVGFLEPTVQCCVVGHGKGLIAMQESCRYDVHPWSNDLCKVLEEVV
jgi:hypothetical protein